jgi:hypothetical protein
MAFDLFGNITRNHMLQNSAAINNYTSLLASPMLVSNGEPMSQSEVNAGKLLELVYSGQFTSRVYLSNIFSQDDIALAKYYNTKGKWVLPTYRDGHIKYVQKTLIGLKEADFIITNGNGAIDFCLEVDGQTHCDDSQKLSDLTKNLIFLAHGLKVYRVTNSEIDGVAGLPDLQQSTRFINLLQTAECRWKEFAASPTIVNLQLHKPC